MNSSNIIQKIWSYSNVLRNAGVSYGDYLEQLTYLIFLKKAHEYAQPRYNQPIAIPPQNAWPDPCSQQEM